MLSDGSGITIGVAALILGGLAAAWWKIEGRFDEEADARGRLAADLAEYKLYVAQNHVTGAALRETEERLISALDKLTTRFEAMIVKLESLSAEIARRS